MMDNGDYVEKEKELKREREFLRNIMATIPDSMLILDRELVIKSANRSFYKLFQTEPENVIGRKIADILGDEDGKLGARLAGLFGTEDMIENLELHYQSEKLGERILNITARGMVVAEEEEEEEELVVVQDITERKQAEEVLRRTEENFRRSLDNSPLGIRIINSDGETAYANRAMLDIYGYDSIEKLKTTPTQKRYTPESYAEHRMRKEKRQRGEYVPSNYEISIVRKDGEIRYLEVFRKEVLWNGQTQFQVLYNDVTERKQAEEALKESRRFFFGTLNNLLTFIGVLEPNGKVMFVNNTPLEAAGIELKDVIGKIFYDTYWWAYSEEARQTIKKDLERCASGESLVHDIEAQMAGGSLMWVEYSMHPIYGKEGEIEYLVAEGRDITERKRAEDSLVESNRRLQTHYLVSQLLSESRNLNTVSTLSLTVALQMVGLDAGFIRYLDEAREETVLLSSWGIPSEISEEVGRSLGRRKLTEGLIGQVVQTGLPLVVEDYAGHTTHPFLARAGFQSAIIVPLKVKSKVVGTMTGLSARQRSFSVADTEMMTSIGAAVGMAIANARLFEQVKDRSEKRAAMSSIAAAIASTLNMDTIYATLAGELRHIISYDRLTVGLLTPEGDAISILQLGQAEQMPLRQRFEDTPLAEVIKTGKPHIYLDLAMEASDYPVTKLFLDMGLHSSLVALLSAKGKVLGTLNILSREVGHYSLADLEYIQPIADQLAVALSHARLFQQVESKSQEWQSTFDAMSDGVAIIDNDYRIQRANRSMATTLGTMPQNLIGRHCYEVLHGKGSPMEGCPVKRCREERKACSFELCESHLGNRWLDYRADPLMGATGEMVGVILTFRDITDKKQRQEALIQQKELTDRILATTPNSVLVIDKELDIQLVNQAFCKMFNRRQEDVVGRPLRDVLPVEELSRSFLQVMADGAPRIDLEFRYKLDRGESIFLSHAVPMFLKGEKEQQYLIILRDITLERAAQAQFYHVQSLASIGELAAGVAHEINNPLTTVLGYSELALAADISPEMKADMEVIRRNAQRAATIVKNLLAFARRQEPQKKRLSLNDVIHQVLEIRGYQLKVSNIEVVTEFAPGLPEILADHQQFEQVILNIISNAEYALLEAHGRGTLTIKTELVGNTVRILLADDGSGISRKNLYRIFDPFFTTKGPGKGTGLGLSICHGIVTEHGGKIYAESEEGKGTTFFIELPIAGDGQGKE
ncbi:MAG: PAS domain S-box protein [Dehalococcoidia bacterium]|nr:PAS domain S-box protein [Dehalococcoidia bacterium]